MPWDYIVLYNDDFFKGIVYTVKGICLLRSFLRIVDMKRRLDIVSLAASVHYKIDFSLNSHFLCGFLLVFYTLEILHNTDVNIIPTTDKLIVYDVFHNMCFFNLPEIQSCVPESNIGVIILQRRVKIFRALYIISLRTSQNICVQKEFKIFGDRRMGNVDLFLGQKPVCKF